MSEQVNFFCDICGVQKRETNHWFKGYLIDAGLLNSSESYKQKLAGIMIVPWDVIQFSRPFQVHTLLAPDAHLCGEQCALKWQAKTLGART